MANDTRNDDERPCYLDAGAKLFPEAPAGQRLDLTDPLTRDQELTKHIIREGQQQGMKPVRFWLFSHEDARSGATGVIETDPTGGTRQALPFPYGDTDEDFYGEGGSQHSLGREREDLDQTNFYKEQIVKVFSGPFSIRAEYLPTQAEHILTDFGIDRPANDVFHFLRDDAVKELGRLPQPGDLVERFDGIIFEILTSMAYQPEHWEWLYQQCGANNTQKSIEMFTADD